MKEKKLGRGFESLISETVKEEQVPEIIPRRKLVKANQTLVKHELLEKATPPPVTNPTISVIPTAQGQNLVYLNTSDLVPNRLQPRKVFAQDSLDELINSIRKTGVLQPIMVRKSGLTYEIVMGERRWRASKELKIDKIPAIIKENVNDREMLEWALIENTQRKDLNPMEKARGYKELMNVFSLTQEQVAERVSLDRSTIANFVRLLDLPIEIQDDVSRETISPGHARALLGIDNKQEQIRLSHRIKKQGLSVRSLENIIARLRKPSKTAPKSVTEDIYIKDLEDRLRRYFGTKVSIAHRKNRGNITIEFYSNDDFQRIVELLTSSK
jgi:ParB family transcriptional regulator, chromosome partitioning protein